MHGPDVDLLALLAEFGLVEHRLEEDRLVAQPAILEQPALPARRAAFVVLHAQVRQLKSSGVAQVVQAPGGGGGGGGGGGVGGWGLVVVAVAVVAAAAAAAAAAVVVVVSEEGRGTIEVTH